MPSFAGVPEDREYHDAFFRRCISMYVSAAPNRFPLLPNECSDILNIAPDSPSAATYLNRKFMWHIFGESGTTPHSWL